MPQASDAATPLRSAIITDHDEGVSSLVLAAGKACHFASVGAPSELELVLRGSPELIVMDVEHDALELLDSLRELAPDVPVVIVGPDCGARTRRELIYAGAADVFSRAHLDPDCLRQRLEDAIVRHDILSSLREQAMVDPLTGLLNRRGFAASGERHESLARRRRESFSVMVADIDGLKQINDTFGHAIGDRALVEASGIFRATCRGSDAIARLGGDEFAVLAIGALAGDADRMVERLRAAMENRNARGDLPFRLAMSFGLAWFDPAEPCTLRDLLSEADAAMYVHKRRPRRSGVPAARVGAAAGGWRAGT